MGHFAFRGVVVERLTHFVGLMVSVVVSVLILFIGARKASLQVDRLEKSVGKLGLVAFLIRKVVVLNTLALFRDVLTVADESQEDRGKQWM